jgi:ribonuclease BN (tRNA processing enzyme)
VRLHVVGCSGSFPAPGSAASCYLVEADDADRRTWRVLLDLGSGALGPLQRLTALRRIDAVLLSHLHPDHCLDMCGLYVALRFDPAGPPATKPAVHGPRDTLERLSRAYSLGGEPEMAEWLDVSEWSDTQPVPVGPLRVTPYRVEHPVEAFGMRVEHEGAVLAYTGDTDTCPALLPLARDADLLLSEASFTEGRDSIRGVHLTGRRAGQAAALAGVRRLVLTHLPVWTDPDDVLAEARSAFSGPVEVARPGQVYELGPAPPAQEPRR